MAELSHSYQQGTTHSQIAADRGWDSPGKQPERPSPPDWYAEKAEARRVKERDIRLANQPEEPF